jgi:opacity protein-like surface antigen
MWNGSDNANAAAQAVTLDPSAKAKFSAIQGTGHVQYMIPAQGAVHPYLQGGLGMYDIKAKIDADSGSSDDSQSNFGWNLGGGFNYAVSPAYSLGLGAAYHNVQTDPSTTNLFTVNATILFGGSK